MKRLQKQLERNQLRAVNAWAKYRELHGHSDIIPTAEENYQQYSARIRAEKWEERAENIRREIIAVKEIKAERNVMRTFDW